ncbi:EcsC family protein, partial [Myroides odoratimimus]
GVSVIEGGATGWFGVEGLIVDIPVTITMAMYTINKIGMCYGFKMKTEEDYIFALNILSLAGSNTLEEKTVSLLTIKTLQQTLKNTTWKKMAQTAAQKSMSNEAFLITVKSVSKKLGVNLTKRKALQVAPVVGAAVGAGCNFTFINDVSWAAIRVYQDRWLIDKYNLN